MNNIISIRDAALTYQARNGEVEALGLSLIHISRTGYEMGNIQAVMDGDIDGFINAYLTAAANGELK